MTDASVLDFAEAEPQVLIIGAGGHAKVLLDALGSNATELRVGILDRDEARLGSTLGGVPIYGDDSLLESFSNIPGLAFVIGIGSVSSTQSRKTAFEHALSYGLLPLTIVHKYAMILNDAQLGKGCQVLAGAIIGVSAHLGCNVLVNSGATVEHDCIIGDHTHVATGAKLGGGVKVGSGAHIGIGAVVKQGVVIGANATVGAGAVVLSDVLAGSTVVGVPARELRR